MGHTPPPDVMKRMDLLGKPRRWEILLFVVWWVVVLALTLRTSFVLKYARSFARPGR